MTINKIDFIVKFVNFPNKKVKETVTPNEDGTFTVFIESTLSTEQQRQSFIHAVKHVLGDDFCKFDVENIEMQAHNE